MDFKNVSRSLFLISCFLAFYSAGKLPATSDDDRMVAGECLQFSTYSFFDGDVRKKSPVTEFFKTACVNNMATLAEIQRIIKNHKSRFGIDTNISGDIKECLQNTSNLELFDKYTDFGRKFLSKTFEEAEAEVSLLENDGNDSSKHQPAPSPDQHDSPQSSSDHTGIAIFSNGEDSANVICFLSFGSSCSENHGIDNIKNEIDELKELWLNENANHVDRNAREFGLFFMGLCESPKFRTLAQLEDSKEDKSVTLNCASTCVKRFFNELQGEFMNEKGTFKKIEGYEIFRSSSHPHTSEAEMSSLDSQIDSFQDITDKTKGWLEKYNNAYEVIKILYLRNDKVMNVFHMDKELLSIYSNYNGCIRWECDMDTEKLDIPLSKLILETAAKSKGMDDSFYRALVQKSSIVSILMDKGPVENDTKPNPADDVD